MSTEQLTKDIKKAKKALETCVNTWPPVAGACDSRVEHLKALREQRFKVIQEMPLRERQLMVDTKKAEKALKKCQRHMSAGTEFSVVRAVCQQEFQQLDKLRGLQKEYETTKN